MTKGEKVTIYEDPITRKIPEGEAVLLDQIQEYNGSGFEIWRVQFTDDEFVTVRSIYLKDIYEV